MYRFAALDMYNYSFIFEDDRISGIHLYFDADDMQTLSSVSTDITSHDNLIYLEGKRFVQLGQNIFKNNTGYVLDIIVQQFQLEKGETRERIQQSKQSKSRNYQIGRW